MNNKIYQVGYWSGYLAFASAILFGISQALQLIGAIMYPWDEILIYGFSLCIVVPFLLEILALHYVTPDYLKYWSHAALIFTVIYAVFVTANYVVQLATVIPMSLKGHVSDVQLLVQTPHSLFWNFDAIGYISMGLATLFAVPALGKRRDRRWVRFFFIANGLVTPLIAFVYFYPRFSNTILLLGIPWALTAPLSMLLLASMLRNDFKRIVNQQTINQVEAFTQL